MIKRFIFSKETCFLSRRFFNVRRPNISESPIPSFFEIYSSGGPFKREPMYCYRNRNPKVCSAEEAVIEINSGNNIFIHSAAAAPLHIMRALAEHGKNNKLNNIKVHHMHIEGEPILTHPDCYGVFRSNSFFTGSNCRKAVEDGEADFTPIFLNDIPIMFRRNLIPLDFALIQVSPPDEHGFCSLGTSVDCTRSACQTADKIIAQVNKFMPRVFGHGIIHVSQIDTLVYHDNPLPSHSSKASSPEDIMIGKLIAENLVEDGATLQMGIGSIPDSVLSCLSNHQNLGIHSEMVSDGIVDLIHNGNVTNSFKKYYPGKTVSSFSLGTEKLYKFLNNNPTFVMADVSFTNSIEVISQNPKVTAINSCIEVDITGQVVSDSLGKRIYSGVGGQLDFITGASRCTDGQGKPILAMHSVTNKNKSKIVPIISEGAGVVTTRSHVHYIVTEYGIADLFGKSIRQRAYELIKIAHPDHREAIEKEAYERFKVMPSL